MKIIHIVLAVLCFIVAYIIISQMKQVETVNTIPAPITTNNTTTATALPGDDETQNETVYTQDYYPWWRSTRWFNYDGWLYQKPYYNYWRRPYYFNYWLSGRPLIIGGKRYYERKDIL